jgi:hypothetical protein
MSPSPLPPQLPAEFSIDDARALGVSEKRLRLRDLELPFRGVRIKATREENTGANRYALARARELELIRALAARLQDRQFFCHRSAALIWGAPLPLNPASTLHLGVVLPQRAPRVMNVVGHTFPAHRVALSEHQGLPLTSPAFTFACMGSLPFVEIVALGDYLVRKYRAGYGRRTVGKEAFASISELNDVVRLGRWPGATKLRRALPLIREDSWSPRESRIRVLLVLAGLPEPELNADIFDDSGEFLGCVDLVYRAYKVIIEYLGEQHSDSFASDVERIERLRTAGWIVLQVTKVLARQPDVLISRVGNELKARGWNRA